MKGTNKLSLDKYAEESVFLFVLLAINEWLNKLMNKWILK